MSGFYLSSENYDRIKSLAKKDNSAESIIKFLYECNQHQISAAAKDKNVYNKLLTPKKPKVNVSNNPKSNYFKDKAEEERLNKIENCTLYEAKFAEYLDLLDIKYKRERIFYRDNSCYFADFYIMDKNIVVEIDGEYHDEEDQIIKDNIRTSDLINKCGVKEVVRFKNHELIDEQKCFNLIIDRLKIKRY